MKIWSQYGSEHSMNLVMIGTFKEAVEADQVKQLIDEMIERVRDEPQRSMDFDPQQSRFSKEMLEFLMKSKLNTIGPAELDQFNYDLSTTLEGNKVVLRTDESEISAVLKLMIERGARVEVYSAHDYPEKKES
jgi:hypothetical protein